MKYRIRRELDFGKPHNVPKTVELLSSAEPELVT